MLLSDEADIAAASLSRTWERDSAVTFGISIMEGEYILIAHVVFEKFVGKQWLDRWKSSTEHDYMMLPLSKNVTLIKILCHPVFTLKSGQNRNFHSVKLDDIGFGWKPHFWNQETSHNNAWYLVSIGQNIANLWTPSSTPWINNCYCKFGLNVLTQIHGHICSVTHVTCHWSD